jgi:hypothetical protein
MFIWAKTNNIPQKQIVLEKEPPSLMFVARRANKV